MERTYGENVKNINDIIIVSERLYYEENPESKMNVPSSVYEKVERLNKERREAKSPMNLYQWCKHKMSK